MPVRVTEEANLEGRILRVTAPRQKIQAAAALMTASKRCILKLDAV